VSAGSIAIAGNSLTILTTTGTVSMTGSITGTAASALTLQNGSSTGDVTLTGNVTVGSLTFGAAAYRVSMTGTSNTITSSVGFVNTGGVIDLRINNTSYINFKDGGSGNPAQFGSTGTKGLILSGASSLTLRAAQQGIVFQRDSSRIGSIQGQVGTSFTVAAMTDAGLSTALLVTGSDITIGAHSGPVYFNYATSELGRIENASSNFRIGSAAGKIFIASGSNGIQLNVPAAVGVEFQSDGSKFATIKGESGNTLSLIAETGYTTANVLNTVATTVNFAGFATTVEIGSSTGTTSINNSLTVDGNTTLGNASGDDITFTGRAASDLVPKTNNQYDLGTPDLRWRNMYTGDLHLRNDRGSWTIIEEEEYLSITNNLNGKRYKFVMQEI